MDAYNIKKLYFWGTHVPGSQQWPKRHLVKKMDTANVMVAQMKNDCELRKFAEIKLMAESYLELELSSTQFRDLNA